MSDAYDPIQAISYGPLHPKVSLEPDFFTGFQPADRDRITQKEAAFYRALTAPYSVDDQVIRSDRCFAVSDGAQIPIRIYTPKAQTADLPAVLFFHGGGFMTCSIETHDYVPAYLAATAPAVVISVGYRLAPEHKFPIGLEDCYAACQWMISNAQALRCRTDQLFVCGDSSGGNFAAAVALMARDRAAFHIQGQILIYPVTDPADQIPKRSVQVYGSVCGTASCPSPMLSAYFTDIRTEAAQPYASPMLSKSLNGLPDALFIIAGCDGLADDGLIYANRLRSAGVRVVCRVYEGMPHAFILRTYSETFEALKQICAFIGT